MKKKAKFRTNLKFRWGACALVSSFIFLLFACGGNKTTTAEDEREFEELKELVSSRRFEIENRWLNPLRGGQINLIGNPNMIRFDGDSVEVYLPYFGVRTFPGGYGREGGVKYKGPAKELTVTEKPEKKNIELRFEGKQESENLQFIINIYSNGNTRTSVNTSERDQISYEGEVKALPESEE